jgi:hypothetical protein
MESDMVIDVKIFKDGHPPVCHKQYKSKDKSTTTVYRCRFLQGIFRLMCVLFEKELEIIDDKIAPCPECLAAREGEK